MSQSRTAENFSAEEVEGWKGETAFDKEKTKLGQIEDIYLDPQEHPRWLIIKMGTINSSEVIAPAQGAFRTSDGIHLDYEADKIKEAPKFEPKGELEAGGEEQLAAYYGLDEEDSGDDEDNQDEVPKDEMPIPAPVNPRDDDKQNDAPKKLSLDTLATKSTTEVEQTLKEGTVVEVPKAGE